MRAVKVPAAGNNPGAYTYYFGADLARNGVMDLRYFFSTASPAS